MSSKRPAIDLMALTSDQATPMHEAAQRTTPRIVTEAAREPSPPTPIAPAKIAERVTTANLEGLAFKVPPSFRRRFRSRAAEADLKLNELLFAALEAWEAEQGLKK